MIAPKGQTFPAPSGRVHLLDPSVLSPDDPTDTIEVCIGQWFASLTREGV